MALKTFSEGDAIKASETNANNQYLLEQITSGDSALNTLITSVQTSLNSAITNLSNACVKLTGTQTISGNKTFSGTSTFSGTTEVPASTTAGTALQLAAQSKSANGYIKLGSGIIIQWGYTSGSAGAKNITFPTAFTSENVRVITQNLYTSQSTGYQGTVMTVSSTGFAGYQPYAAGMHWVAIGY